MRHQEKIIMLQVLDTLWKDHLLGMDHLKEGIGLRGYAQKNPLTEYKKEGFSVLSVSIDNQKSLSQVRSYVRINNYSFDVFLDPNMQVFKKMNGNLMPTNILLDQKGNIIWRHYGYLPGDEKNMNLQIRSALNLNS